MVAYKVDFFTVPFFHYDVGILSMTELLLTDCNDTDDKGKINYWLIIIKWLFR